MKYIIPTLLILSAFGLHAQSAPQLWKVLADVAYVKEYDDFLGFEVDKPVFSDKVLALEGQTVEVSGYIIPIEGYKSHKEFIFSAYPYQMCFFCGGAGPETVMEILADEAIQYTAEAITIKGKLELNESDINRLMYAMTGVVKVD